MDELFPPTESERLEMARDHVLAEVEKREKAVASAEERLNESREALARIERGIVVIKEAENGQLLTT